jgi:hypothetical protein
MTMACHIRQALLKLLKTWEEDETGSYKDSFIMSESALKHAEIDDHVSESYSRPDSRIILERAEVDLLFVASYWHSGAVARANNVRT